MQCGIAQCYLPPDKGDIPAFTPAEAGTQFSDPGGMQGWVDLADWSAKTVAKVVGATSYKHTYVQIYTAPKIVRTNLRRWHRITGRLEEMEF